MTREYRITLKRNIAAAVEVHNETRRSGPAATVAELIDRIGNRAAVETVAAIVNCVGSWDGRVSDRNRAWAAGLAPDRDTLRAAYIFLPSEIHPAHIDQIASAMARRDAE